MAASGTTGMLVGAGRAVALGARARAARAVLDAGDGRVGTLTAGLVAAAPAELRGAAMGLYSLAGFGGGMLGPVLFGAALDAAGGAASRSPGSAAYARHRRRLPAGPARG